MLWTVRQLWLYRDYFVFSFYCHWSPLVLRNRNGIASFLHRREGVTQGDPLAMITYGIDILPLIKNLKRVIPDVPQPWYSDDAGALGMFTRLETYFYFLTCQGLGWGYYPNLYKSVLIVRPENFEAGKVFGARHRFKVCKGAPYLAGYIRDNEL